MRVYKKTLIVSIVVCFILAVLSVILNFWSDFKWISFVVNWCVGIACSIVVVIITTYIQYKAEKYKITIEMATAILAWLSKFYSLKDLLDKSNENIAMTESEKWQKIISNSVDEYTETTYKCLSLSCEYVSFSKKSSEANNNLNYAFAMVHKLCTSAEYDEKPLQLIQKLKFTINIIGILEDLEVFLRPSHLHYVRAKLNELVEKNKTSKYE